MITQLTWRVRQHLLTLAFLLTIASLTITSHTQESDNATASENVDSNVYEEIIVTAEKREENVLEVPITMSAFNSQLLEELGLTAEEDLEQLVPGLQFAYDSEGNGISIRGIGTQKAVQTQADTAVAFYVDGVYSYKTYAIAPNFFDLDRVEVARGPQGTLNGRNSIAGSVSFITKKPTESWDVSVLGEITDQFSERLGVAVGGPLSDTLMFRLSGTTHTGDGAQPNEGTGGDYNAPDQKTLSPQLRFVNDKWDVNLKYMWVDDQGTSRARVTFTEKDRSSAKQTFFGFWVVHNAYFLYDKPVPSVSNCPPGQLSEFGGICDELNNAVLSNRGSQQDSNNERWTLNADFELNDNYTIRYTYGSNESHTFGSEDGDGTDRVPSADDPSYPADLSAAERVIWDRDDGRFRDTENAWLEDDTESSHEVQIFSKLEGPLNFVAGAYRYENESSWRDRQHNWANPLNTTNAEDAVANIDRDMDGQPDYSSCQEFYDTFVIGPDDPTTEFVEGLEEDPGYVTHCVTGNNHSFDTGGGAGAGAETTAVFLNVEYQFSEKTRMSGGLRWTEDAKSLLHGINGDHGVTGFLSELPRSQRLTDMPWGGVPLWFQEVLPVRSGSWDAIIGHASMEYSPSDKRLYYARLSTGFRAGGFNQISGFTQGDVIATVIPATFPGEDLVNYEIGIKGSFLDSRLILSTGAYFQDFKGFHLNATQFVDEQFRGSLDSPFLEFTENIDGTEIWGGEVEGVFFLNDKWRLSGYYNFLDSSVGQHSAFFDDDRDQDRETFLHTWVDRETGESMTEELELPRDVTGNQLPQQPNHKYGLTVTRTANLAQRGRVVALSTYSYTGDRWSDIGNVPYQKLAGYGRWDLRGSWESEDRVWNITGYVQNIFDEIGIQEYAYGVGWLTEHRQIGLQLRWRPNI